MIMSPFVGLVETPWLNPELGGRGSLVCRVVREVVRGVGGSSSVACVLPRLGL